MIHRSKYFFNFVYLTMLLFLAMGALVPECKILAQTPPITDVVFSADGQTLVTCSQKGVQVLKWPELSLQRTIKVSFTNLHCVVFSPDGKRLAIGGGNPSELGEVEVLSWPEGKSQMRVSNQDDSVVSIVWRGNDHMISGSLDRSLTKWDLEAKKPIKNYLGHSRAVTASCILRSGELVTTGHDQSVRVWNADTGELIRSLNQHSKPVYAIAVCPNSEGIPIVATAAQDRSIRFWQPSIGRMMRYVRLDKEALDIEWIDPQLLVASCVDGKIRVVDTDNVKVIGTVSAMAGWAYAVAAHPSDGTIAVAGSEGRVVRIKRSELNL